VRRRSALVAVLTTVLVLIAAAAWWRVADTRDGDGPARAAVMAAAARATTALMSRQPNDPPVRSDVQSLLVGRLADEYASQGADIVLPGAVEQQMRMTARVVGTGVAGLEASRARVLVFVDLWAAPRSLASEIPRVPLARWAAMRNVDGKWLLAGLTPVGGVIS